MNDAFPIVCATCGGYGYLGGGPGFFEAGELPGPSGNPCPDCGGSGYRKPRFFCEIFFRSKLSAREYWLPIYIETDDRQVALKRLETVCTALRDSSDWVKWTNPIPETRLSQVQIQTKFKLHNHQKLAFLDARVWSFKDYQPNTEWSFDENLSYIANNLPLEPGDIAQSVESHKFPVRVIRAQNPPFDFNEFLVVNIVKSE